MMCPMPKGGHRPGAGRKPKPDGLVPITVKVHPIIAARWKALGSTPGERADMQRAVIEAGMRALTEALGIVVKVPRA